MFAALRSRNFALLWLGTTAVNLGWWMHSVAMGWLIYSLTSSASWLGRIGFAQSVPTLLLGLVGGVLIDRSDRRRILCGSALLLSSTALVLATLTLTGTVEIWMIILLSLASGTGTAVFMPVFQALIPSLVPPEHLMNAISLNSVSFNAARVVGPLIAGFVMTHAGVGWCFAINGCCSLAMVLAGLALRLPPRETTAYVPLIRALRAGLDYARLHPVIRALLVLCAILSLFGFPYIVLMPAFAREVLHLEANGFTLLFSCVGMGAVLGGLTLAWVGSVRRRGVLVLACAFAFGALLIALAQVGSLVMAAVVLVLVGFAMIVCVASLNTLIQVEVADHMRARVMSMLTVLLFGLPTMGAWVLGAVGDRVGIPIALTCGGAVVILTSAALALFASDLRESREEAMA